MAKIGMISAEEYDRVGDMVGVLKKMVARLTRKATHGCADVACLRCDPDQKGDDTWRLHEGPPAAKVS